MKVHLHDMELGIICDEDGLAVADCNAAPRIENQVRANAAFIVRAVNCHQELIDLLKATLPMALGCYIKGEKAVDAIRKAIAKAEGK